MHICQRFRETYCREATSSSRFEDGDRLFWISGYEITESRIEEESMLVYELSVLDYDLRPQSKGIDPQFLWKVFESICQLP